jgi:hypothetical protein
VAVLGGGGLGIASTLSPGVRGTGPVMTAALTATSCPSMKLAIGTLTSVSGSTLVIKPVIGPAVRVSTSASTTVTREVKGTLADVRDGMHVIVSGARSGGQITARRIGVTPSSLAGKAPALSVPALPVQRFQPALALGLANGTVADATSGGFTVDEPGGTHVRVSTSSATTVVTLVKVTVAGLRTGERTVAVGSVTGHNALAASTVEQEDFPLRQPGPGALPAIGWPPTPRLLPTPLPRLLPKGLPARCALLMHGQATGRGPSRPRCPARAHYFPAWAATRAPSRPPACWLPPNPNPPGPTHPRPGLGWWVWASARVGYPVAGGGAGVAPEHLSPPGWGTLATRP